MAKLSINEATIINEQDRTPKCASCTAMADDGEEYCPSCKDFWEQDVPAMWEAIDRIGGVA